MNIFPAIDTINGEAVRLYQGDFSKKTTYSSDPISLARSLREKGCDWLHLVDLDGARGKSRQLDLVEKIVATSKLKVQVGGGVKTMSDVEQLLDLGVSKVVLGTTAVKKVELTKQIISKVGSDRVTIALDVTASSNFRESTKSQLSEIELELGDYMVATHGWQVQSATTLKEMISAYSSYKRLNFLITDVSKDGTLEGPNFSLYEKVISGFPGVNVLVSGGVSSLDDLLRAKSLNASGVIIGKAMYDEKFSVESALKFRGGPI